MADSTAMDVSAPVDEALAPLIDITLHHHGKPIEIRLPETSTLQDFSDHVESHLNIPQANQKFLISPKIGLKKPPFNATDSAITIKSLQDKKIVLLGSTASEISTLSQSISRASAQVNRRAAHHQGPVKAATPARTRPNAQRLHDDATYTFHSIRPLPYLPNPQRSHDFLVRLANDPGIRAAMRTHRFSVGLLTEMNPAEHTTDHSRTLGLNRNAGEVIELRLRTDAYDGYRDYKTIRRTLCHELAHNVWGEHDRNFHNLWTEIEKIVQREDWTSGGRSVTGEVFYDPPPSDEQEYFDHGGWTGGEFVLGRSSGSSSSSSSSTPLSTAAGTSVASAGLSRREILAKAAEERSKRQKEAAKQSDKDQPA